MPRRVAGLGEALLRSCRGGRRAGASLRPSPRCWECGHLVLGLCPAPAKESCVLKPPSLAALNAAGRGKSRGPPRAWAGSPREPKHCEHRPEESWAPKPRGDGVRDTLSRSST